MVPAAAFALASPVDLAAHALRVAFVLARERFVVNDAIDRKDGVRTGDRMTDKHLEPVVTASLNSREGGTELGIVETVDALKFGGAAEVFDVGHLCLLIKCTDI